MQIVFTTLAGVLADGGLMQQHWDRFARVLAPAAKVHGASPHHAPTRIKGLSDVDLDASIAAKLGALLDGTMP